MFKLNSWKSKTGAMTLVVALALTAAACKSKAETATPTPVQATTKPTTAPVVTPLPNATATMGPQLPVLLATINITSNASSTLLVKSSVQLTATGMDTSGKTVAVTPVWSIFAGGGTVTASGLFTAGPKVGTYVNAVRATVGSVSGYATLTIIGGDAAP